MSGHYPEIPLLAAAKKRRLGVTLVEALVAFAILLTLAGLLLPAGQAARGKAAAAAGGQQPWAPPPPASDWRIRTVKHDEHLFVIGGSGPEFCVHHPDCPCGRKAEVEW